MPLIRTRRRVAKSMAITPAGCPVGGERKGSALGTRVFSELSAVFFGRLPEDLVEGAVVNPGPLVVTGRRQRHSGAGCQFAHDLYEAHVGIVHQESDGSAVGAAAETVVELFILADGKGGGLLVMKRAAGVIVFSGFFQSDPLIDQIDNIGSG